MAENYDVVILGGGTGGYVAAIRASQLGFRTAIVEMGKLGGTCLHTGCIPSKALLKSAEVFQTLKMGRDFGVVTSSVKLDFSRVQKRKSEIITRLYQGVQGLIKKGGIDVYEGKGRILGPSIFSPTPGTISVELNSGEDNVMLLPEYIIIATGSRPRSLPGLEIDNQQIITSTDALEWEELPPSVLIIGGGIIGVEWSSMLVDFGVEVTMLEMQDRILPTEDVEISKEMEKSLRKKGVTIVTGAKILPEKVKKGIEVTVPVLVDGQEKEYSGSTLLISVGRIANVDDIGLQNTSIELTNGYVKTNQYHQTKESHIYAIGDVIGGLQLAHVATHEGIVAVEHIAGKHPLPINEERIAKCIYSSPEAASIGLTESQARENGFDVKVCKFPFKANGKALIAGKPEGFVKLIVNVKTDDLLGIHMIGSGVTELIAQGGLATLLDATPWEIAASVHPHPSLSEVLGEAAFAIDGRGIHF